MTLGFVGSSPYQETVDEPQFARLDTFIMLTDLPLDGVYWISKVSGSSVPAGGAGT